MHEQIENVSQSLYKAREKKIQEETQLSEIEKLKETKPNMCKAIKKTIQAEKLNLELKNANAKAEEDKNEIRMEYAKVTTALGLEEKVKKKYKDMEVEFQKRKNNVESLRKTLQDTKNKTKETIESIENSVVKDLIKKCNELRVVRAYYADQIKKLKEENEEIQNDIEITSKNPKKIPPAVANQNLRGEVKTLELQITERSKEIKEKEREKFQLNYSCEETLKTLALLRKKAEEVFSRPQQKVEVKQETTTASVRSPNRTISQKKIEAKRDSVLEILGKGMTEGMSKEVMKALKGVGKPGQGIASKVLELNRCQFGQPKSLALN